MMDRTTAEPGISVAETLRRKRKMTITTSAIVSISVNSTSRIEPLTDSDASNSTSSSMAGGSAACNSGRSLRISSTI